MLSFERTIVVGTAVLIAVGLILVFQCPNLITRVENSVYAADGSGHVATRR